MFRPVNVKPFFLWLAISSSCVFVFGGVALGFTFSPLLEQKFESLRYRVLEMVPPPPHTEFVATSLPTREIAQVVLPSPTTRPTVEPTQTAVAQAAVTQPAATQAPPATSTPAVHVKPALAAVELNGVKHDYQRWNNCGPTTLEMYLSFFGKNDTQVQIANVLKPDPDDKNVSPDEIATYARGDGLNALVRINGSLDRIKLLLSNGLPVMVETGFDPPQAHQGWMGHYRLITGYDDKSFITQDSYDGPNVKVEFGAMDTAWRQFNRTYILLFSKAQGPLLRAILSGDVDDSAMYSSAVGEARLELAANPKDAFAAFNLGSSLVGLEDYPEAAAAFDQARQLGLPWRMLWYQFGPYVAYLQVGRYDEVVALADATLKPVPDLEESHYYKGLALEKLGEFAQARSEFASALQYNKNYTDAQLQLAQLAQQ